MTRYISQNTKLLLVNALMTLSICVLFISATTIYAQWSGAPSNPPGGNIAAPIHTGGGEQMKSAGSVPVGGPNPDRITTGQFLASDRMLSDHYCDVNGENCFAPGDANSGGLSACVTRIEDGRGEATAYCNADEVRTGGGCLDYCDDSDECGDRSISGSYPVGGEFAPEPAYDPFNPILSGDGEKTSTKEGWACDAINRPNWEDNVRAYAVCCPADA